TICELGKLLFQQREKPLGDLHLGGVLVVVHGLKRNFFRRLGSNPRKSLKILGIDQYRAA
ncbi:MAG: hypothetical protein ACO3J4_09025, partial [Vulcanococcus sp.]